MRLILLLMAFVAGCGNEKAASTKSEPISEYNTALLKYVNEVKVLVKSVDLAPSKIMFRKKIDEVKELYTRLPDVPSGNTIAKSWNSVAKKFIADVEFLDFNINAASDFERLGSAANAEKTYKDIKRQSDTMIEQLKEFESAIKLNRVANIKVN